MRNPGNAEVKQSHTCNTKDPDSDKHEGWPQEVSESHHSSSETTVRREGGREISDETPHWWEGEMEGMDGQRKEEPMRGHLGVRESRKALYDIRS